MKKEIVKKRSFYARLKRFIAINIWVQKVRKQAFGKWYWFSILHFVVEQFAYVVHILIVGQLLNQGLALLSQGSTDLYPLMNTTLFWVAWRIFTNIVSTIFYRFDWYYSDYGLEYYVTKKIFNKLLSLHWETIETPRTQKLIRQSLVLSSEHLAKFGTVQLEIVAIFAATVFGIVAAHIPWWVILIIIVKELPSIIIHTAAASKSFKIQEKTVGDSTVRDTIRDYFRSFATLAEIKVSHADKKLVSEYSNSFDKVRSAYRKNNNEALKPDIAKDIWEVVINSGLYVYYLAQVITAGLSIGSFYSTTGVIQDIGNNVYHLLNRVTNIIDHYRYSSYFYDLTTLTESSHYSHGSLALETDKIVIEFKDVSFKYRGAKRYALKNVNLVIEDNDRLALVGENGAGKSTFLKLLTLLYRPTKGVILVNGVPLKEYDPDSVYEKIAVVTQDFARYDVLTVAQNISIYSSSPVIDTEKLKLASKLACVDEYIAKLPEKYNTLLSKRLEGGTDLSTGQWQRIAIARQFYANRPLVILDEPTSAIDPIAEAKIFSNLYEHVREKTVVVVSHRYNTVKAAKKILVFNDGQIIEQGSHKELLDLAGYYANAYKVQNEEKSL
jgi:ABC-type multidrug transport system fused ATPase/permease subunit